MESALSTIDQIAAVEGILEVCLKVTGMGYGVVAQVTEDRWLACSVLDKVEFGLPVGGELPIQTTLCNEVRQRRATIAFDHASADPQWRDHHTPRTYGLESYIAVPIILEDGELFGTLCAIDPKPAPASRPETVSMFELFAQLIATQIEAQRRVSASEAALLDAHETSLLREQFIAVLGHDLRNPLAAIEAGTTMLARKVESSDGERILREMRRVTARMGRLINDVLDFARGRLGSGLTALLQPTDLTPVLSQVVDELRASYPDRSLITDIDLTSLVDCDPDRIAQLASNLLANAVTHGDAEVPVRLRAVNTEAAFVLTVTNGGGAIPPHVKAKLFQPFTRRHTGEVQDGLGLGLYICNQIATAHEGDLTVSSVPGETCFELRMPLGAAEVQRLRTPPQLEAL